MDEVLATLRGWRDLDRDTLLKAFEAGNFAGVEEMRRNDRLLARVAPMGVNDIMMAVQYRRAPRRRRLQPCWRTPWPPRLRQVHAAHADGLPGARPWQV